MRLQWASLVFCVLAGQSTAEIVPVQIGERGAMTRVMLTIPVDAGWDVQRTRGGLQIVVDDASGFTITDINNLDPQSTIIGASGGLSPDTLKMGLRCDCAIQSYLVAGKFLTIDITKNPQIHQIFGSPADLLQPWHQPQQEPLAQNLTKPHQDATRISTSLLDSEISTGIAQATYRGFLELRETEETTAPPSISPSLLENIAIGVEAQLQTIAGRTADLPDPISFSCSEVGGVLSDAWSDDMSFSLQAGAAHRLGAETSESIDPEAMRNLALVLIGHGFGLEAKAVLMQFGDETDLTKAVIYMAEVIDADTPPSSIGMETCNEQLAFWSFLHDPLIAGDEINPRKLLSTYKLLPGSLQKRLLNKFADALTRSGHQDLRAEIEDFRNTAMALNHKGSTTPPPTVDLENTASARDILRSDLTETDLDPGIATRRNPNTLPLSLLETLRLERRGTPGEIILLDEVLARHVDERNYVAVINLLIDSEARLNPELANDLTERHLTTSVSLMTDPELVAFAFRDDLPTLTKDTTQDVYARLVALGVPPPDGFASVSPSIDESLERPTEPTAQTNEQFVVPAATRAPVDAIPTFAESQELLSGSVAMRNAIETLINDAGAD